RRRPHRPGRSCTRYVEPRPCSRYLVQREEALVHRSAARDSRGQGLNAIGKLNLFQSAMLRWRELHPYSAVHVVQVRERFDRDRAEAAIANQLCDAGLTGLVLDRARRRYEYRGGPASVELTVIGPDGDCHSEIRTEIERQLNRPFPADGALVPFRFFAHDAGNEFRLGLAYDHFIAGGDSIVVLLNDIVGRYLGARTNHPKPNLYPPTLRPIVVRNAGKLLRTLDWLARIAASCRRGMRPRYADHADGHHAVEFVTVAPPAVSALRGKAKTLGVTRSEERRVGKECRSRWVA